MDSFLRHFHEFTLGESDLIHAARIYAVVLAIVCIIAKGTFSGKANEKRLSWVITLVNSFAMTLMGAAYLFAKAYVSSDLLTYMQSGRHVFHGLDNVSALVCLWFGMANVVDLVFGLLCYPKYVQLLTGYIHHTIFIWIMIASTTGNGGFVAVEKFAPAFLMMTVEELPTFLLALGSVFKSYRTDYGFGGTFFILRIVYHGFMMYNAFVWEAQTVVVFLYGLTLTMHLNWFYGWVRSMLKGSKVKVNADKSK